MPDPMTFMIEELPPGERRLLERVMRLCHGEPCGTVQTIAATLLLDVVLSRSRDLEQIDAAIEAIATEMRQGARANLAAAAAAPATLQ